MAPKKKSDNSISLSLKSLKTPKEKTSKLNTKKKNVLKVKIQRKNVKNAIANKKRTSEDKSPAKASMKKMLTMNIQNDMKIDRMNEVARAQLVKECPVAETVTAQVPAPKKRGRKKKILEPETAEVVPKKKAKLPKKARTNAVKKVAKTKESKDAALKRKAPSKTPPSISPLPKRHRGRLPKRGKPKEDEESTITSPCVLNCSQPEQTPVKDSQKTVAPTTDNNYGSRRTSVTSAPTSELSWTKDISGSSTTTCVTVTSNDFFRIDGKLPELKLTKLNLDNVDKPEVFTAETMEPGHSLSEDSSSSSSSSSSSPSHSDNTATENGLNLSTSSISAPPYSPTYTPRDRSFDRNKRDEVTSILEMLVPKLKSLDLDFSDNDSEDFDMSSFEEKVCTYLEEEYNTFLECDFLSGILSESYLPQTTPEIEHKHSEEPDFAKPGLSVMSNKSALNNLNDTPGNITRRRDTYDTNEDDDVLSIYAENVFDSTRMSSTASNFDEYVPQPLIPRPFTAVNYQPSKIEDSAKKTVCEKQNADSTSIHKEPEIDDDSNLTPEPVNEIIQGQTQTENSVTENKRPPLTISCYPCPAKSYTLRGVCFFYLISTCKYTDREHTFYYPHRFIEDNEFKKRLAQLGEEQFFQEYNHIARKSTLRKKYVKCFIDECQRRELPKILVEVVIDFLRKTPQTTVEDEELRVQTVEHALIYLNEVDLAVCEQLLDYTVQDVALCDIFMKIIANTQNFSRFKNVFIKLTDFMVRANRTFDFDVAVHILERLCILPFEASLANSLISIIGRTDRVIFNNTMSNIFELLLDTFNKELHQKFMAIKTQSVTEALPVSDPGPPCPPSLSSPCGSRELPPLVINPNSTQDYEQRYTSPDTTNTDNVHFQNKPVTEPKIIRTLNYLRPPNMNMCRPPPVPEPRPGPGPGPRPQGMFRRWNQRSILSQVPRMPFMRPPRPMNRPPSERPQFKFQRRYGPDY